MFFVVEKSKYRFNLQPRKYYFNTHYIYIYIYALHYSTFHHRLRNNKYETGVSLLPQGGTAKLFFGNFNQYRAKDQQTMGRHMFS